MYCLNKKMSGSSDFYLPPFIAQGINPSKSTLALQQAGGRRKKRHRAMPHAVVLMRKGVKHRSRKRR